MANPRDQARILAGMGGAIQADRKALQGDAPPTTNDLTEYARARQQGYQGSWMDYQRDVANMRKVASTTVNVGQSRFGTIPPGFELRRGQDGGLSMSPIEGSPAARGLADAEAAAAAKDELTQRYGSVVAEDIGRAIDMVEGANFPVTGFGSLAAPLPGTPPHDLSKLLDTVKANAGFDKLQQMREASPTGGALGQVSERENQLLQAAIGNLEQSQSTDQLLFNLRRVGRIYSDIIHGPGNGPRYDQGGGAGVRQGSQPMPGMIEDGYRFLGGDPADPNNWERAQ